MYGMYKCMQKQCGIVFEDGGIQATNRTGTKKEKKKKKKIRTTIVILYYNTPLLTIHTLVESYSKSQLSTNMRRCPYFLCS